MINKQFLSLWVIKQIDDLDNKIRNNYFDSVEEAYKAQGRFEMLKELFDAYNLDEVDTDDVVYHKNI